MYVCVCNAVTDREVEASIEAGARTRAEVTRSCGAGGDCGSCHRMIEDLVEAACGGASSEPALLAAASLVRERAA